MLSEIYDNNRWTHLLNWIAEGCCIRLVYIDANNYFISWNSIQEEDEYLPKPKFPAILKCGIFNIIDTCVLLFMYI